MLSDISKYEIWKICYPANNVLIYGYFCYFVWLFLLFGRAIVPPIQVDTPVLDFGRCFINYPYERIVELSNESNLAAKYELVAQVRII